MFVGTKRKEVRMNRGRIIKRRGQIQQVHRREELIEYFTQSYEYGYRVG